MKCVCPMGGDRTCPDNCLIAVWHSTPPDQRTKERRRPLVEQLAKQGYTQEAIGMQLGVSHATISRDIETLFTVNNVKGQGKDTRGRKKSTGRPKGTKQRQSTRGQYTPQLDQARAIVRTELESGNPISPHKLQDQHGISHVTFDMAITAELARKETLQEKTALDPDLLSKTAQEKLEAAIRARTRRLEEEIEARLREEMIRWLNDVSLPQYTKELTELERSIISRRGIMDRISYRKILACLHPDRVTDPGSKKRYEEAFLLFTKLEKRLLDEKESPTEFRKMPRTYQDLMAMRAKVQAERRAKRATTAK